MTDNPGIIFIHGMFLTGRSWEPWIEHFTRAGYQCTAPSWPGREGEPKDLRESPSESLRTLTLNHVVEQFAKECSAQANKPIVIGHSMGGLVAQILHSRGLCSLAVAIDSAPPLGVKSFALSHLRANAPVLYPGSSAIVPSLASWKYAFWHTGTDQQVQEAYDTYVVPESRLVGRGPLGKDGSVDFKAPRPPLLMIAGELDHIIPPSLNRTNFERYEQAVAPTDFKELKGRTHFLCGQPGWEEVADTAVQWLKSKS